MHRKSPTVKYWVLLETHFFVTSGSSDCLVT